MLTVTRRTTPGLLDDLRSLVRGQVLAPGEDGYDEASAPPGTSTHGITLPRWCALRTRTTSAMPSGSPAQQVLGLASWRPAMAPDGHATADS